MFNIKSNDNIDDKYNDMINVDDINNIDDNNSQLSTNQYESKKLAYECNNKIISLENIYKYYDLHILNILQAHSIVSLNDLSSCKNLQKLSVEYCNINDLDGLKTCVSLICCFICFFYIRILLK